MNHRPTQQLPALAQSVFVHTSCTYSTQDASKPSNLKDWHKCSSLSQSKTACLVPVSLCGTLQKYCKAGKSCQESTEVSGIPLKFSMYVVPCIKLPNPFKPDHSGKLSRSHAAADLPDSGSSSSCSHTACCYQGSLAGFKLQCPASSTPGGLCSDVGTVARLCHASQCMRVAV